MKTSACKLCRREGVKLFLKGNRCETSKCAIQKRNFPPGAHPWTRVRHSEYRTQLREKQKLKRYYGVAEKQFTLYYDHATRMKGNTGENLLVLLERRLDNVFFQAGFAPSRRASSSTCGTSRDRRARAPATSTRCSTGSARTTAPPGAERTGSCGSGPTSEPRGSPLAATRTPSAARSPRSPAPRTSCPSGPAPSPRAPRRRRPPVRDGRGAARAASRGGAHPVSPPTRRIP